MRDVKDVMLTYKNKNNDLLIWSMPGGVSDQEAILVLESLKLLKPNITIHARKKDNWSRFIVKGLV